METEFKKESLTLCMDKIDLLKLLLKAQKGRQHFEIAGQGEFCYCFMNHTCTNMLNNEYCKQFSHLFTVKSRGTFM